MKKIYLVKKNPALPESDDNWIIMDRKKFRRFMETEDGKRRSGNFINLNPCDNDDAMITMELSPETVREGLKSDKNACYYRRKNLEASGYTFCSYSSIVCSDGETPDGESLLIDETTDVEAEAIGLVMLTELHNALAQFPEEDRNLIMALFLSDYPMSEAGYATELGVSQQVVHYNKIRILKKLRRLLAEA